MNPSNKPGFKGARLVLAMPRPRNPVAPAARQRQAGSHQGIAQHGGPTRQRQAAQRHLRAELGRLYAPPDRQPGD